MLPSPCPSPFGQCSIRAPLPSFACVKVSVCLTLSADAHDHRALPCPAPCRARARGASPAAPASLILRWAVPSNSAGRGRARAYPSGRTPAIDIARLSSCATRPPAFLRRLHPETSRHREPGSLEINAAPSDRRITTRRRLAGDVRRTRGRRPSARGAVPASVPGAIYAQVPPSSPPASTRDQHDSPTRHTQLRTHTTPSAHITMDAPRH